VVRPPYQEAAQLVWIAAQRWPIIDGEAAQRGVDYFTLPFDRFLNVVYWWAAQRVKSTDEFDRTLAKPVGLPMSAYTGSGMSAVTEYELEADAQSFMAFAGAFGIAPPKPGPVAEEPEDVPSTPGV
jgi:hypothetical protein